ncbi:glucan endo-1,3-beta-D-glucosidase [Aspergillus fijiensis CBS 313.89]|uniref:Glucan endo-1,3-beta-D-glucosidase 1 n=1 Tax=Aspergillus fijiensis CBS 313.89 TaxID=1448319 RepID=A0A8G1RY87_9EURO|nr:uncharacterized protein BO72DRAFT_369569 [Aspergillus fijiensis CBS 313.89]RAK81074.1 hypothetical protein BO72DRAFT_369569 [Aspergillus fijiensis CBS 313.89]
MERRMKWHQSLLLTWLLAAEKVYSAPQITSSASTALRTQFPPAQNERLLIPEAQGYYPTSLEREGRTSLQPYPTVTNVPHNLNDLLHDLESPADLLDLLLPDFEDSDSDSPAIVPTADSTSTEDSPFHRPTGHRPTPTPTDIDDNDDADDESEDLDDNSTSVSSTDKPSTATPTTTDSDTEPSETSNAATSTPSTVLPSSVTQMSGGQDVFVPLATGAIPPVVTSRGDHPVPKKGIENVNTPIETNKFYSGIFLGSQTNATFTHPYAVAWAKGSGSAQSFGMAVWHNEANVVANGPTNSKIPGNPISYYVNPIGIQHLILSATELKASTVLTGENLLPFSADAVLKPDSGSSQRLTVPLVQGMGFVTGLYTNLQPLIQTGVFFRQVVTAASPRIGIFKYKATMEDGSIWLIYAVPQDGKDPNFQLESNTNFRGPAGWSGFVQITKNPGGDSGEKLLDGSAGVFALEAAISGTVNARTGTYQLSWAKSGTKTQDTPLMMYALPHHVESFDATTKSRMTSINLRTTTKGNAIAVVGETWTMVESDLPTDMGFAPWSASSGNVNSISAAAQKVILAVAPTELNQSIDAQTNLNSMYYSGKALSKFATLVYTVNKLGGDPALAASALQNLKTAFSRFSTNQQQFPLVYDTVWKGVVSSASYGGDSGADFGNTYYNDHHFHYGYFIHAAAIIGSLDPTWLSSNKDWVNMLVRDAGNSAANDPYFPFSRAFDWFNGHSWAKGLFESFDGKDQESTSEDTMFAYALKMWGKTISDPSLEARGNLMLGILRRSLHNYFLLESDNKNQPANFIANKVTGILFENKVDHTTYFGANLEYVQGIHMLPLMPFSGFTRRQNFVREEWNALFASTASTPASNVVGGWKGVLYANLALIDPTTSWDFFAQSNFDYSWIDGGASRTWYLAYAAGKFRYFG